MVIHGTCPGHQQPTCTNLASISSGDAPPDHVRELTPSKEMPMPPPLDATAGRGFCPCRDPAKPSQQLIRCAALQRPRPLHRHLPSRVLGTPLPPLFFVLWTPDGRTHSPPGRRRHVVFSQGIPPVCACCKPATAWTNLKSYPPSVRPGTRLGLKCTACPACAALQTSCAWLFHRSPSWVVPIRTRTFYLYEKPNAARRLTSSLPDGASTPPSSLRAGLSLRASACVHHPQTEPRHHPWTDPTAAGTARQSRPRPPPHLRVFAP